MKLTLKDVLDLAIVVIGLPLRTIVAAAATAASLFVRLRPSVVNFHGDRSSDTSRPDRPGRR